MEEKGAPPDESWMNALKEAAATAFLGTLFIPLVKILFVYCFPSSAASETVGDLPCTELFNLTVDLETVRFSPYDVLPHDGGEPGCAGKGTGTD